MKAELQIHVEETTSLRTNLEKKGLGHESNRNVVFLPERMTESRELVAIKNQFKIRKKLKQRYQTWVIPRSSDAKPRKVTALTSMNW
jgi:hypothetical protein